MKQSISQGFTVGDIARESGRPIHGVVYFIKSRGIKHVARAGKIRLFDGPTVERIVRELRLSRVEGTTGPLDQRGGAT